jgi:hypothetical protein
LRCGVLFLQRQSKLRFESLASHREEKIAHSTKNPSSTDSTPLPDVSLLPCSRHRKPHKMKAFDMRFGMTGRHHRVSTCLLMSHSGESSECTKEGFLLSRRLMPPQTRPGAEPSKSSFDTYSEGLRSYPRKECPPRLLGE